ncbi:N-acetylglucosamine-6-sulfatase-like [Gigantopelta aegis]|uniref:N-acetylglucosamine-6-sulfatase-like n=1 Tax=Gigantopelta aegis TaxID=1735272 RepID=UPI001B888DEE|nr:N-acetylglucosamine-6-sulfatase-like [Gigantopelta aegis]
MCNGVHRTKLTTSGKFVTSPLCCPSRSSILTGKYVHNHGALNNSVVGNCSSGYWQQQQEKTAFPVYLQKQGYTNFFAGKYLNQYGFKKTGGVGHVPPGWHWWNGLVGNSKYYGYSLSVNGTEEKHGHNYTADYLTDVIHRRAIDFLQQQTKHSAPFFMMLSTPSCHAPFTPAPQYNDSFSGIQAPRDGSFDVHGKGKHWLIEQAITPMPHDTVTAIDDIFRNRWRTLLSVDDMVEDVVKMLQVKRLLENTYIFFSSDNGYHLGQFSLPNDKRQLYEFDIRVPLMVRGPGIEPKHVSLATVLNIDLAPTFLDLARIRPPSDMDGVSMVPILHPSKTTFEDIGRNFLVEHYGEHTDEIANCPQYKDQGMANCNNHCVCEDSWNNTYTCLRSTTQENIYKFCELKDNQNFVEMYNLMLDPLEIMNVAKTASPELVSHLSQELSFLSTCSGKSCHR